MIELSFIYLVILTLLFFAAGFTVSVLMSKSQASKYSETLKTTNVRLDEFFKELDEMEQRNAEIISNHKAVVKVAEEAKIVAAAEREKTLAAQNDAIRLTKEKEDLTAVIDKLREENNLLGNERSGLESRLSEALKTIEHLKTDSKILVEEHRQLQTDKNELESSRRGLIVALEERENRLNAQQLDFIRQRDELSNQFKALADEILQIKSKSLQESSITAVDSLLTPFRQTIESFRNEVQKIHNQETLQQGELRNELKSLMALNQKITQEAHDLSTALRGQKKIQGNWGELILENILEKSGLEKGRDYLREASFNTETGRQRPDAIIKLPDSKHIIIDSKVSLEAWTQYVNDEGDNPKEFLNAHIKNIKDRIKELAGREYHKISDLGSPEIVIMFIPIEAAYAAAVNEDTTLFLYAIEKKILIATPSTLLTSLNIVRQLWWYADQNKHAQELASRADAVYNKLRTFLTSFHEVKKHLDTAAKSYHKAEGQLCSGRGNLINTVEGFKELVPSIKTSLPDHFIARSKAGIYLPTPEEPVQPPDSPETIDEVDTVD
ncbi:DNA recombination protein RmuC [Myxococcota bacterium]|nr:DNA recombination protein RmuC [Myxococcota bacterium]MBU1381851.1 DNA recombination protein RmuC [Myxococcota bacterium]MBU1495586.1 DNA recombination protein RmuC [Myxococcota bacterium]